MSFLLLCVSTVDVQRLQLPERSDPCGLHKYLTYSVPYEPMNPASPYVPFLYLIPYGPQFGDGISPEHKASRKRIFTEVTV